MLAIHVFFTDHAHHPRMGGWFTIMTNRPNGTLSVGVTSDLIRRVRERRERVGSRFVRRYVLTSLVYFEHHKDIRDAIQQETSLKRWLRAWKVRLLVNPKWNDLYSSLLG
jgi:putative endonuclease